LNFKTSHLFVSSRVLWLRSTSVFDIPRSRATANLFNDHESLRGMIPTRKSDFPVYVRPLRAQVDRPSSDRYRSFHADFRAGPGRVGRSGLERPSPSSGCPAVRARRYLEASIKLALMANRWYGNHVILAARSPPFGRSSHSRPSAFPTSKGARSDRRLPMRTDPPSPSPLLR